MEEPKRDPLGHHGVLPRRKPQTVHDFRAVLAFTEAKTKFPDGFPVCSSVPCHPVQAEMLQSARPTPVLCLPERHRHRLSSTSLDESTGLGASSRPGALCS